MKIHIDDQKKVSEIQDKFSGVFPWLKLEFFSKPHLVGDGSPKSELMPSTKTIGEVRTISRDGSLVIEPSMTVGELEQAFRDIYGLSVQVFRKSGKSWLETTVTDKWTLEKQNAEGEVLSTPSI